MNALLGEHNLLKLKERINCINVFTPHCFFILLQTSGAVLGCVGILVSICPCLLLITAATEISSVLVGKFVDVIIYPNGNIIQWKLC